jgi:hypothetical protein
MTTEYTIDRLRPAIRALEGARIADVGRTVDMVELGLRREAEWIRLHVHCPFRMVRNERVLLGSADMGYPLDRQDDQAAARVVSASSSCRLGGRGGLGGLLGRLVGVAVARVDDHHAALDGAV